MIGKLICWWKNKHDWSEWIGQRYSDGRTWYWARVCNRCHKIESTLKDPKKNLYDTVNLSLKDLPNQPFKQGDIY